MLLNGVHLLPDPSGALIWPARQLLAVSPVVFSALGRDGAGLAAQTVKRLAALARQRRPRTIVWLGETPPALAAREQRELDRLRAEHDWREVAEELVLAPLTFRLHAANATAKPGEIIARPQPLARIDGESWPAFVIDGRRLCLPAFGPHRLGTEVMGPAFPPLFRRPFQALMIVQGRILTRPRARLEPPS